MIIHSIGLFILILYQTSSLKDFLVSHNDPAEQITSLCVISSFLRWEAIYLVNK